MSEEEINYFDSYISKDKIREKIEKLNLAYKSAVHYNETKRVCDLVNKIDILKELLEE